MAAPVTFENSLRIHDQAVMNWLNGMTVDYGAGNALFTYDAPKNNVPIIAVMSRPDAAAAAIWQQLVVMRWLSETEYAKLTPQGVKLEQMPLPAVSIYRETPRQEPELRNVAQYLRSPPTQLDPRTNAPYIFQFPASYRTRYNLSFWCNKKYTEAFMQEWLLAQFGGLGANDDEIFLPVVHDVPFGTVKQSFKLLDMEDRSELEGTGLRYMRYDVACLLRTWIIKAPVTDWGGEMAVPPKIVSVTSAGGGLCVVVFEGVVDVTGFDPALFSDANLAVTANVLTQTAPKAITLGNTSAAGNFGAGNAWALSMPGWPRMDTSVLTGTIL